MSQENQQGSGNKLLYQMLKHLHRLQNYQLKYQNLYAFISQTLVEITAQLSQDGDKIVYKNNDEHTSPIKNTYAVGKRIS